MSSNRNFAGAPFLRVLVAAIEAGVPALLWGQPGIGKSAVLSSLACDVMGRHLEVVTGGNRDQTDFLGLPVEDSSGGHPAVVYAPPAWAVRLANADRAMLFLDELTTASASVSKAMLRVVQERWVGELHLPGSVAIVAAANPPDQSVDGIELAPPVANRFLHLDWQFDVTAWMAGLANDFAEPPRLDHNRMVTAGGPAAWARVYGAVAAFLRSDVAAANPPVPDTLGAPSRSGTFGPSYAYASPRSWHNYVRVAARLYPDDEDALMLAVRGSVGEAVAAKFLAWTLANDLYDPADVLTGRVRVDWSSRPDRLFALTEAIVSLTRARATPTAYEAALGVLADCATHRKDLAVPATRTLLSSRPDRVRVPGVLRDALSDVLLVGAR